MHFNSSLFTNFRPEPQVENDTICLVLTDFPTNINLTKTKQQIEEEFTFITKIQIIHDSEIQCIFESMTDLIELDQGTKYGAGRAFIRHFSPSVSQNHEQLNFQNAKGVFQNSKQTFASESENILGSYKFIPSLQEENQQPCQIDPKLRHYPLMQRLTSLENEVEQLEHLREELYLFKKNIDHDMTFETDELYKSDDNYTWEKKNHSNFKAINPTLELMKLKENSSDEIQDQEVQTDQKQHINTKQLVISLLEGAALTGIILGGVKLFKNLLK